MSTNPLFIPGAARYMDASGAARTHDWHAWRATHHAVLTFVTKENRVLLIHKKRGLGAGKINAPGGRVEPGETALQAAVRETQEEVGVTPTGLEHRAVLRFAFTDGYGLVCHVFMADNAEGALVETDEAKPFWCDANEIPYGRMWADDRIWLPLALEGRHLEAWFIFDGDAALWHQLIFTTTNNEKTT